MEIWLKGIIHSCIQQPWLLVLWIGPKHPCKLSEFWKHLTDQISIYIHWDLALVNTLERRQMALGEGMRMILGKWSRDQMPRHILTLCVACPLGNITPLRHIAPTAPRNSVKPKAPAGCPVLAAWCRTQCGDQWCRYEARASTCDCGGRQAQKSWWVAWLTSYSLPVLWSLDKQGISSLFHACLVPWTKSGDERVKVPKWTFPSILRDFQVWEAWNFTHLLFHGRCVTSVYD